MNSMKYTQSPLFILSLCLLALAPFSGYALLVMLCSGVSLLVADVLIRKFVGSRLWIWMLQAGCVLFWVLAL